MIEEFLIKPYIGASPLRFGMSECQVTNMIGPPDQRSESDYLPQLKLEPAINADYPSLGLLLAYNMKDELIYSSFNRSYEFDQTDIILKFDGIDIFNDKLSLQKLVAADGSPFIWVGFIMLMNLGVRLGGVHEHDDAGYSVSLFKEGRYDAKREHFKKWSSN